MGLCGGGSFPTSMLDVISFALFLMSFPSAVFVLANMAADVFFQDVLIKYLSANCCRDFYWLPMVLM